MFLVFKIHLRLRKFLNLFFFHCFETWCWRRMEKISWTDRVKSEILNRLKEERNILGKVKKRRKAK